MCTSAVPRGRSRAHRLTGCALAASVMVLAAGCGSGGRHGSSPSMGGPGYSGHGTPPSTTGPSACGHNGDAEPSQLAGTTAAHNSLRCQVRRPSGEPLAPLSWSSALAAEAQQYAAELAKGGCGLAHAQTEHGENLFGSSAASTPHQVVERWARERQCFHYGTFPQCCSCTCGHYTQLVWGDSRRLGCGKASCANGAEVWVCRYDPAGNVVSRNPY